MIAALPVDGTWQEIDNWPNDGLLDYWTNNGLLDYWTSQMLHVEMTADIRNHELAKQFFLME